MNLLFNKFTDWLKNLLAGGIVSNLTGLFDRTNSSVGDIANQVGAAPQDWNSGIFTMIQNLSENVILPIAGIILAFVMALDFIQLITEKNNMQSANTEAAQVLVAAAEEPEKGRNRVYIRSINVYIKTQQNLLQSEEELCILYKSESLKIFVFSVFAGNHSRL